MSALETLWLAATVTAAPTYWVSFAVLMYVDIRRGSRSLRAAGDPWKPPRWLRRAYHLSCSAYLVSGWFIYLADGYQWYDTFSLLLVTWLWWVFKKGDDWDDEDRRRDGLLVRGVVERLGNRLRVRAVAPATGS